MAFGEAVCSDRNSATLDSVTATPTTPPPPIIQPKTSTQEPVPLQPVLLPATSVMLIDQSASQENYYPAAAAQAQDKVIVSTQSEGSSEDAESDPEAESAEDEAE